MIQITYVAKLNQTNGIIQDILNASFDIDITLLSHEQALEIQDGIVPDLVIYDLNTSSSALSAPKQVQAISRLFKNAPIITLQSYLNRKLIDSLLKAGSVRILSIAPSEEEIQNAVNETLKGNTYISLS